MEEVKVEITIRDNETGDYLRIPVLPEKVGVKTGKAVVDTVKVLNLGNVDYFNGTGLDSIKWSSFFPVRYDPAYCSVSDLKTPEEYKQQFLKWKDNGTRLQLISPAAGINHKMYIQSFNWRLEGAEGEIYYDITFKQDRKVRPKKYNTDTGTITDPTAETQEDRDPVPEEEKPSTYKVKEGDTLTLIAKKTGTEDWRTIYNNNESTIGPDPDKIYPGQVLVI